MKILKILSSAIFCAAGLAALGSSAKANIIPKGSPLRPVPGRPNALQWDYGRSRHTQPILVFFLRGHLQVCGRQGRRLTLIWKLTTFLTLFPVRCKSAIRPTSRQRQSGRGPTPEPIVERAINAVISQVVSTTALAGVTYTLDVDLGFGTDGRQDLGSVYLMVGNNQSPVAIPLPSYGLTRAQMQGTGNFYDFQTSYTATGADAGDPITIVLSSITGNTTPTAYFADVRPGTFTMFGN